MKSYRSSIIILGGFFTLLFITFSGFAQTTYTAHPNPTVLIVKQVPLTVNGKIVQRYMVTQPDGTWGYRGVEGEYFNVVVKNETTTPLTLHWHGIILPNSQDGIPYITQPLIPPQGEYHYYFKLVQSGTHWMHSHYKLQIQNLMSAPFIIYDASDAKNHNNDVIMFLSDFTFQAPEKILKNLQDTKMPMANMAMGNKSEMNNMSAMKNKPVKHAMPDLADVQYDALLTNYHTLDDPQIVSVKPNEKVRLRIIAGSAATNFQIDTGSLVGKIVAVDGEKTHPLIGKIFGLAIGQTVDIEVTIPKVGGAFPILAKGVGQKLQTGLILATPGATITTFSQKTKTMTGAISMQQEAELRPLKPLANKPVDNTITVALKGTMNGYVWSMNDHKWPDYAPLEVKQGQRVKIIFKNDTGMSHPMHLHGHNFEVIAINSKKIRGAVRNTVLVPAHGSVTVIFDANNPGNWMIHCHVLYHAAAGMMSILNYENVPLPKRVQ